MLKLKVLHIEKPVNKTSNVSWFDANDLSQLPLAISLTTLKTYLYLLAN